MSLGDQQRHRLELALQAAEDTLARLATASHRKSRWRVAATELDQARLLVELERFDEGLRCCDAVLAHFGASQDGPTQVLLAAALRYKRVALHRLGEHAAALDVCDEVVRRFGQHPDAILQEEVAAAMAERDQLLIRGATGDDLDAVVAVILAAFEQYRSEVSPVFLDLWARDVADVRTRHATGQIIVADAAGTVAGTVTLYPESSRYGMPGWPPDWAVIRLLAVEPAARGRQIGSRLVAECIDRARRAGAGTIGLHTAPFMVAAQRTYERFGFERVPSLDVALGAGPDALAFRRTL